jgi:hypothetical protein
MIRKTVLLFPLYLAILGLCGRLIAQDAHINPGGQLQFAFCLDPPGQEQEYIWWSVAVAPYSGFHDHDNSSRPDNRLSPENGGWTDQDGCVSGTFYEERLVAGIYEVYATDGYASGLLEIWVIQFPYFQWLPQYYKYQLKGEDDRHETNHYGTFNTVYKIQQICEQFYDETGLAAGVNDISLPWGGVFDLNGDWDNPHQEHQFGMNVDMPFQYLGTPAQRNRFREIATNKGASVADHGDHYHLSFAS